MMESIRLTIDELEQNTASDLRGAAVCVTGDRAPLPGRPLGWDQHGPKAEKDRKNNSEAIRQM